MAYLAAVVGLLVLLAAAERPWFRSSIFELLPASDYDPLTAQAIASAELELGGRLLFLFGHEDRAVARAAAESFAASLNEHALIDRVSAEMPASEVGDVTGFYFRHRRKLLTPGQIAAIRGDAGRTIEQQALARIYSPLGAVSGDSLASDPFVLFPDSMQAVQPGRGALTFDNGFLWITDGPLSYALVSARTVSDTLDMESQARLVADIEAYEQAVRERDDRVRILSTGFMLYANAGAQSARSEISIIGTGSLIGILALILWIFRSLRPLWLSLLTIASGCLLALTVTLWTFGSVHLFTLVFGASLIGVSIDYTFHYLAEESFAGGAERGDSLSNILPGITLGLITSVIAYVALTVAPFPGLKQLAVFSSAGLVGAYLTLLCCARWFRATTARARAPMLANFCARYVKAWRDASTRSRVAIAAGVAALAVAGLVGADVNDDVTILQTRPPELRQEEEEIGRLLQAVPSNTFLVLRAASAEALLQLEEAARGALDELVLSQSLGGYVAISQTVPSAARQQRSLDAYAELVAARLPQHLAALGMPDDESLRAARELSAPDAPFTVEDWLDHAALQESRALWLGRIGDRSASLILLTGSVDLAALRGAMATFPSVAVVDRAADLSALLAAYRHRVGWLVLAGYAVIFLFLAARYGVLSAFGLVVPPVLAGLLALGVSSLIGIPLNLFSLLALILVLGIGIDFTIFLKESRGRFETTMVAVTLSAITTILSFGLLALSETNAVRAFGLIVLVGIAGSYVLAPVALGRGSRERHPHAAST